MNAETAPAHKSGPKQAPTAQTVFAKAKRNVTALSLKEIQQVIAAQPSLPVFLTLDEAAAVARLQSSTLKRKVSEGSFENCVKRGKPLLFFRDRFISEVFRGEQ